jgi:hypothetical protein
MCVSKIRTHLKAHSSLESASQALSCYFLGYKFHQDILWETSSHRQHRTQQTKQAANKQI